MSQSLEAGKMNLIVTKENEDGSVDIQLENLSPRFTQMLLQEGLIVVMQRYLDNLEEDKRIPALLKEKK
jgi:hypothetical protein